MRRSAVDRETRRRFEEYRREQAGPIENTLIDELADGELDRGEFLQRATMFGLSVSAIGAALELSGHNPLAHAAPVAHKVGGRLKVGIIPPPVSSLDPHTYKDTGGLQTGSICGEFLTRATQSLTLDPELATSWTPNAEATIWTYKLRPNVKFQSGQAFGADDVVATFERLVDPNSGSQALSAYKGVLSPGGTKRVDNLTVQFHLDAPTASFPYLTSSTTYQAILLPADYKTGTFEKTPQTTGAFRLVSYTPGVGAKFERFAGWWGGRAPLDGIDVTYYTDDAATTAALLGGQVNLVGQINFATGRPLFNNSNVQIFNARGATHRQVCMRVDVRNPLRDWRVRQAIALTLDRPAIVKTLFGTFADVGNDSPFAPVYPSRDPSVPQRKKNIRLAKRLMAAAGYRKGFAITLTTEQTGEIPQLAQIIQRSVRAIGIRMNLKIITATAYFAGSQSGPPTGWGTTPWLNAPVNITDWGHRAVPNVYLTSALETKGIWNAAHYASARFDRAAKSYIGAIAVKDQRRFAGQMQRILLHDTPVIFPYFYNYLGAGSKNVKGYKADAQGSIFFSHTSLD
ncbi:MAG: ABC transporter substrate-binding protein [Actinobacteria bacterium]|nr:MAG: ABC transporter substrate-binding protein [Actinomycetota bacterium]